MLSLHVKTKQVARFDKQKNNTASFTIQLRIQQILRILLQNKSKLHDLNVYTLQSQLGAYNMFVF